MITRSKVDNKNQTIKGGMANQLVRKCVSDGGSISLVEGLLLNKNNCKLISK